MESFFTKLYSLQNLSLMEKDMEMIDICNRIDSYVKSGTYTKGTRRRDVLDNLDKPASRVAELYGVSESTIKVTKRELSKKLYEIFGYDFFTLLTSSDAESKKSAILRLSAIENNYSANNLLLSEVSIGIRNSEDNFEGLSITDCSNEIKFLIDYSKPMLESKLKTLDMNKLAFLKKVLNQEEGTVSDTYNFINTILKRSKLVEGN